MFLPIWNDVLFIIILQDHTRLSHWILDGDPTHANLLSFALTETNYSDTTVLLCVSMTTPWNIMDQLQNWATVLQATYCLWTYIFIPICILVLFVLNHSLLGSEGNFISVLAPCKKCYVKKKFKSKSILLSFV